MTATRFTCAYCNNKSAGTSVPVYTSDPPEEDGKLEFCGTCSSCYSYLWSDGVRRTFRQGYEEDEEEDGDYGDIDQQAVDDYGAGGARCRKIGTSIQGLTDCGFELEFLKQHDGDLEDVAWSVKNKCEKYVASVEYDGSLDRGGAEVVTHYGPIDVIFEGAEKICKTLQKSHCRSHNTTCCGLHVSISRAECSTYNIARFVVFWNSPKNKEFLEAFARRWNKGFCKPKVEKSTMPKKNEPMAHLVFNTDRYELVNLQNRHRIEIRAFRGTTKTKTTKACISLCVWLMAYCKTDGALVYQDFLEWCKNNKFQRGEKVFEATEVIEYWKAIQEAKNSKDNAS